MSSTPDVKPIITGPSTLRARVGPPPDVKPTLPIATNNKNSIDFTNEVISIREERQRLEEKHQLHRSVLDLREEMLQVKEENLRLREGLETVKAEPGLRDIKPDISESAGDQQGDSKSKERVMFNMEGDDDDIVFVGETKCGITKSIVGAKPGQCSLDAKHQAWADS